MHSMPTVNFVLQWHHLDNLFFPRRSSYFHYILSVFPCDFYQLKLILHKFRFSCAMQIVSHPLSWIRNEYNCVFTCYACLLLGDIKWQLFSFSANFVIITCGLPYWSRKLDTLISSDGWKSVLCELQVQIVLPAICFVSLIYDFDLLLFPFTWVFLSIDQKCGFKDGWENWWSIILD